MNNALIAASVLLSLAVVWYFFLRGGNGGCTAHHFQHYRPRLSFRVEAEVPRHQSPVLSYDYKLLVQRKHVATCEHTSCTAKDSEWRTVEQLERDHQP